MAISKTLGCAACLCALMLVACSGDAGKKGADGVGMDGLNGLPGADGDDGMPGAEGANGTNGNNGTNGTNGLDGADGDAGVDGEDGLDGDDGDDGDDGAMGAMGAMGTMGTMGTMGLPGTSGIIDRTLLTGDFVTYDCVDTSSSNISGTFRFAKFLDGSTLVTFKFASVTLGRDLGLRNSHIHNPDTDNTIVATLNKVDDLRDVTETIVTSPTYNELLVATAYVNVHLPLPATTNACRADIGALSPLTGNSESYTLTTISEGISGTLLVEERENGTTRATLTVVGTLAEERAAHLHSGSVATPLPATGNNIRTLTPVPAGTNTSSVTNIGSFNATVPTVADPKVLGGGVLTYAHLITLDAYVNIHNAAGAAAIAAGNIGSNAP